MRVIVPSVYDRSVLTCLHRSGAAAFIASAAKHLPPSDVWCILYPSLKHFLRSDVRDVDEKSLLLAMKYPLSRQVFDAAVQWAMKADKTSFWRSHRPAKSESPRESMATVRQTGNAASRARSEEYVHMSWMWRMRH